MSLKDFISEIIESFKTLPIWVVAWMFLGLAPVNLVSLFFLNEPNGVLIACLALGGILPNVAILLLNRGVWGVSDLMTVPHILAWPPLLYVIYATLPGLEQGTYRTYLYALAAVNLFSLCFDFRDAARWIFRSVSSRS